MSKFDDLEESWAEFPMGVEDRLTEDGKLVPAVVPPEASAEERKKRREIMEQRSGQALQKKWQDEDRKALQEAEDLAAPPVIVEPKCATCQSPNRLWIERKLMQGASFASIERYLKNSTPDEETPSRKSIANHLEKHMAFDQAAVRAMLEEEAGMLGQNTAEGVRGAFTLRGALEVLIRKGFGDAMDSITTIEVRDVIQMMKTLNELNSNTGTAAIEEARTAIAIFKEALQNVLIKGDIIEREVGLRLLSALQEEILRLQEDQAADEMIGRHLELPAG